ncbi:chemotaxis protein CheA [Sulfitobacter sp. F26204]|uniref:chemotaxis protein CheA n=1 Tax=Sulfitobacter sp. F26204 TaxID=2996014 RepID=UPI00225DE0D3|nr:chemotaxis protein CheA [Sulfitobacter sp. F26204]MCX7559770.1 chemotaxis protein CheA [Sulfitobacter sp. F26204]
MSNHPDQMADIRSTFFVECEDLLEALQDGLETMADGSEHAETINVMFRAVHSIKGGAGAFGLDRLVQFAHRFETVLDDMRAGHLKVGSNVLKVLFQAADHLSDLVWASRSGDDLPDRETANLLARFDRLSDDRRDSTCEQPVSCVKAPSSRPAPEAPTRTAADAAPNRENLQRHLDPDVPASRITGTYIIVFTPRSAFFETGNEPSLLLQDLAQLGEISVACDASRLPELSRLSPETPHLSWIVTLFSDVDEAEIKSIFEFVEDLCAVEVSYQPGAAALSKPIVEGGCDKLASSPAVDHPGDLPEGITTEHLSKDSEAQDCKTSRTEKCPDTLPTAATSMVRVDLDKIDKLVNLIGELVINQAMLSQSLEKTGLSPHSEAMNGLEEFQRLTRNIQDSVMMIRAQPVKSLFQRMSRIVREASATLDKDVRFLSIGETTEVDKTVIEHLVDPLTHMIRNAIDHGIELPVQRRAAGKSPQGRVTLSAAHRSGRVVIEVSDDGAGIDRKKVMDIARSKGLIPLDAELSDAEIDNLLFLPGFSTAPSVSELSGRGVGMDVVRTAIHEFGGRITITSNPGQGTTFSISLPLTLAVLDGMVIEVAGETLVLPLNLVVETLTLAAKDVQTVGPEHRVIELRRRFVPMIDLGEALGYRSMRDNSEGALALFIAQEEDNCCALLVDRIIDQRQVVIKGLDESFHRGPGVAAATILGNGQIALILDPGDLIASAATSGTGAYPVHGVRLSA